MFYNTDLEKLICNRHETNNCDSVIILSGYIGPTVIEKLFDNLDLSEKQINCDILCGTYVSGAIRKEFHKKYMDMSDNLTKNIYFTQKYVHSKIYMWLKDNRPVDVLLGSANFTAKGLANDYQEVLVEPDKSQFNKIKDYIDMWYHKSNHCSDCEINKDVKSNKFLQKSENNAKIFDQILSMNPPSVKIFLLDKPEHVHEKSGLNWGFGSGNVGKDCSYITIRKNLINQIPAFFPNNGINQNSGSGQAIKNTKYAAEVLFDDGEAMQLSFEGVTNPHFYKQITSYPKNNLLGRYIRKRLGLGLYDEITYDHLKYYGKDYIEITNIGDGLYYADFGIEN